MTHPLHEYANRIGPLADKAALAAELQELTDIIQSVATVLGNISVGAGQATEEIDDTYRQTNDAKEYAAQALGSISSGYVISPNHTDVTDAKTDLAKVDQKTEAAKSNLQAAKSKIEEVVPDVDQAARVLRDCGAGLASNSQDVGKLTEYAAQAQRLAQS